MTDDTMAELIERLEKSEKGSRELDGRILCAIEHVMFVDWDGAGCVYRDGYIHHVPEKEVLPYTTSLDAALTLVPEGMCWWIESEDDGFMGARRPSAVVAKRGSNPFASTTIFAATPALALTIAALKAKESAHDR